MANRTKKSARVNPAPIDNVQGSAQLAAQDTADDRVKRECEAAVEAWRNAEGSATRWRLAFGMHASAYALAWIQRNPQKGKRTEAFDALRSILLVQSGQDDADIPARDDISNYCSAWHSARLLGGEDILSRMEAGTVRPIPWSAFRDCFRLLAQRTSGDQQCEEYTLNTLCTVQDAQDVWDRYLLGKIGKVSELRAAVLALLKRPEADKAKDTAPAAAPTDGDKGPEAPVTVAPPPGATEAPPADQPSGEGAAPNGPEAPAGAAEGTDAPPAAEPPAVGEADKGLSAEAPEDKAPPAPERKSLLDAGKPDAVASDDKPFTAAQLFCDAMDGADDVQAWLFALARTVADNVECSDLSSIIEGIADADSIAAADRVAALRQLANLAQLRANELEARQKDKAQAA